MPRPRMSCPASAIRLHKHSVRCPQGSSISSHLHCLLFMSTRQKSGMATDFVLNSQELGQGVPVLFIHGWEMRGQVEEADFEPIFSAVPGFRRIYVDLPGMGSTPANGIRNLDDIYHRIVEFIDSRLADSRLLIVGSSCGGYLARAISQRYADQVDGLLLRVPLIEPADDVRDLDPFQPLVAVDQLMAGLPAKVQAMLGNVLVHTRPYVDALVAKFKDVYQPAVLASDEEVLTPIRANPKRYSLSPGLLNDTAKLLAPTLILCGRQDGVVGYRDSLRLLEIYPRSTFAILDRAGHDLPVDDNGVFQSLVRDWLLRVNEYRDYSSH
jgi:pimeloyl-ACP methyl ester carboxylesterase